MSEQHTGQDGSLPIDEKDQLEKLDNSSLTEEQKAVLEEDVVYFSKKIQSIREEINKVFKGQEQTVDMTLTTILAGGNLLMVGVPGLGKTHLANTLGKVLGLEDKRVQFTPDLMPSDITGTEILKKNPDGSSEFKFVEGPVFSQILLADEINRAPGKTQAALLEAMQEGKVTVGDTTHVLNKAFFVLATQNPVEQEGTYPLPEAQLDRFMMALDVEYPTKEAEHEILELTTGASEDILELRERLKNNEDLSQPTEKSKSGLLSKVESLSNASELIYMQQLAATMPLGEKVQEAIVNIVRRTRPQDEEAPDYIKENVEWGAGPRAAQAFAKAAKAHALIEGRTAPDIQDVLAIIKPVLKHRMIFTVDAEMEEGSAFDKAVDAITFDMK